MGDKGGAFHRSNEDRGDASTASGPEWSGIIWAPARPELLLSRTVEIRGPGGPGEPGQRSRARPC